MVAIGMRSGLCTATVRGCAVLSTHCGCSEGDRLNSKTNAVQWHLLVPHFIALFITCSEQGLVFMSSMYYSTKYKSKLVVGFDMSILLI
jgi:hypothetical protein